MFGNRFEIEDAFLAFYLFWEPREKLNVPLAASLRALFYVVKSFADYRKW